jgi:hypothetical protein
MMAGNDDEKQPPDAEQPTNAQATVYGTPFTVQVSSTQVQDMLRQSASGVMDLNEHDLGGLHDIDRRSAQS